MSTFNENTEAETPETEWTRTHTLCTAGVLLITVAVLGSIFWIGTQPIGGYKNIADKVTETITETIDTLAQ